MKKRALGGPGKWEYEVGEDLSPKRGDADGLTESIANVSNNLKSEHFKNLSVSLKCFS